MVMQAGGNSQKCFFGMRAQGPVVCKNLLSRDVVYWWVLVHACMTMPRQWYLTHNTCFMSCRPSCWCLCKPLPQLYAAAGAFVQGIAWRRYVALWLLCLRSLCSAPATANMWPRNLHATLLPACSQLSMGRLTRQWARLLI